ncbi:hypothetical protein [Amycolatopsis sp. CA-126428]|uniref:hypothetical protein n=1 Tax=Amycolatopsis sp. CA-126428 TaxID=2073158 RepID=UPI0011B07260|nr:hypothetical protein [Amycolatopsis sp. CA-126428]
MASLVVIAVVTLWRLSFLTKIPLSAAPLFPAPLRRALLSVALTYLAIWLLPIGSAYFDENGGILLNFIWGLSLLWLGLFFVTMVLVLILTSFGVDEAHPLIDPIAAIITAIVIYWIQNSRLPNTNGVPVSTLRLIYLSALLSIILISSVELVRMLFRGHRLGSIPVESTEEELSVDLRRHMNKMTIIGTIVIIIVMIKIT